MRSQAIKPLFCFCFCLCVCLFVSLQMTSVERVLEYCDLESEAPPETDTKPPPGWPNKGQILFENMSFAYHRSLPRVLQKISCSIKPREKVWSPSVSFPFLSFPSLPFFYSSFMSSFSSFLFISSFNFPNLFLR